MRTTYGKARRRKKNRLFQRASHLAQIGEVIVRLGIISVDLQSPLVFVYCL